MNLPSSLALPQSKLLRSRVGILILVAAAALIGTVAFFILRVPAPAKLPTPATSPAAQALPRSGRLSATAPAATAPVVYGPPAPEWVKRDPSVVATAAPAGAGPAGPASGIAPLQAPGADASVMTSGAAMTAASAIPGPMPAASAAAPSAPAATTSNPAVPAPAISSSAGAASRAVPVTPSAGAAAGAASAETPQVLDPSALFQREQYVYQTAGRRDPFQSLIDGKYESQSGDGSLVDVGDIHLVGIMWGSSDKFALVEDSRGRGFVLRVGDPVVNGYISGISKTELQVVQNSFGDSQTVTIQLKSKEEGDPNATRNR